jgi:tight adherence protein C
MGMFYGAKALIPLFFCVTLTFFVEFEFGAFFFYVMAIALGYLLPDFWLGKKIKQRQEKIRLGLPDVLDLLVVCIEAGLSIDLAVNRTTAELTTLQPEICDELKLVILEQRAGRPRAEAWRGFANRTNVETIRSLVSVLIQADQFGTSVTRALRAHSETLRTSRRQQLEERASKTTVKLVFPLVVFIFPSMFLVLMGPSMIQLLDSLTQYLGN